MLNLNSLLATAQIPPQFNPPNPTAGGAGVPSPAPSAGSPAPSAGSPAPSGPQFGPVQSVSGSGNWAALGGGAMARSMRGPVALGLGELFGKLFGMDDEHEAEQHIAKMKEEGVIGDGPHQVSEAEARQYMISGGIDAHKTVADYGIEGGATSLGGMLADAAGKGSKLGGNAAAIGSSVAVPLAEHFGLPSWAGMGIWHGNAKDGSFGGRKDIMESNAYGVRAYQMAKWGRNKLNEDYKSGAISREDYLDAQSKLGELPPLTSYFKPRDKTMSPARKAITPEYSPRSDEELQKLRRP